MDDLERKTMFNPVDNYEAKEIISSDLEKYRIVRSKFFYYCTKFNILIARLFVSKIMLDFNIKTLLGGLSNDTVTIQTNEAMLQ